VRIFSLDRLLGMVQDAIHCSYCDGVVVGSSATFPRCQPPHKKMVNPCDFLSVGSGFAAGQANSNSGSFCPQRSVATPIPTARADSSVLPMSEQRNIIEEGVGSVIAQRRGKVILFQFPNARIMTPGRLCP
jgi:hypothetical protein